MARRDYPLLRHRSTGGLGLPGPNPVDPGRGGPGGSTRGATTVAWQRTESPQPTGRAQRQPEEAEGPRPHGVGSTPPTSTRMGVRAHRPCEGATADYEAS